MISGGVFKLLILLGCAIVYTTSGGHGKKVLLKIQVPEIVKHQHHTNVVFVHKHHHHPAHHSKQPHKHDHHHLHHQGDHDKRHHKHHDHGGKAHDFGGHYSHGYGDPSGDHHGHSYGHHYSFNHGHGDDHHGYGVGHPGHGGGQHGHGDGHQEHEGGHHGHGAGHHGHGDAHPGNEGGGHHGHGHGNHGNTGPKKKTHGQSHAKNGGSGKKSYKPKPNHKQHVIKVPHDKKNENLYDFEINYKNPLTGTQHYHYESYNPTYTFDNNNNLRESNQSVRSESLNIETTGNSYPGVENFKTPASGNYEVDEPSFDIQTEHHKENYGSFQQSSEYNDGEEEDKGLGSYAEDYTNPNSVAKYTSDIQHGTINLEDSNYNPNHGNDLEEYIKASEN